MAALSSEVSMRFAFTAPVSLRRPSARVALVVAGLASTGVGCSVSASHFDIALPTDIGGGLYVGNTSAIAQEADEAQAALERGEAPVAKLEDALQPVPDLTGGNLVFSADGAVFARLDGNGGLEVRDTGSGEERLSLAVANLQGVLAVARDGTVLAVLAGTGVGTVQLVRASDGTVTDTGVPAIGQFQFAGTTLFGVDNNLTFRRIEADGAAPTDIATPAPFVSSIVAAPDADRLFGLARPDTNLEDDTLFVLDANEDTARALELPAPNPRLLSVGKGGCLGLLSGKSLWLSGADGAGFATDEQTSLDERMRSLAVAPDCRSAVFSIPEELLVAWVAPGDKPRAVTASFAPLLVFARSQ
jgi:hypothetical protein